MLLPPDPPSPNTLTPHLVAPVQPLGLPAKRKEHHAALSALRASYHGASRAERSRILTALCSQFGYHRKHAIRLMSATREVLMSRKADRRTPSPAALVAIQRVRRVTGEIGSRRLCHVLAEWLPSYRKAHPELSESEAHSLANVSPATLDRRLLRAGRDTLHAQAIRQSYSQFLLLSCEALTLLRPRAVGCVCVREIRVRDSSSDSTLTMLHLTEALSGFQLILPIQESLHETLCNAENLLPFEITTMIVEGPTDSFGKVARDWAWSRPSPLPYSFTQTEISPLVPCSVATADAQQLMNFGLPSISPYAQGLTPYQMLRAQASDLERVASRARFPEGLYSIGIRVLEDFGHRAHF